MSFIREHMVTSPSLQHAIILRVLAAKLGDNPARATQSLGPLKLPDGRVTRLFARHAADAILLDDHGQTALITRRHHPGAGKLALPGGFIDDLDGVAESGRNAALREATEETGIAPAWLAGGLAMPIGPRAYDRPFDIRQAWNDPPGTPVKQGEIFTVSTQGFAFKVPGNLAALNLTAGDDAAAVTIAAIASLTAEQFAVPDHLPMILTAASLAAA